MLPEMKLLTTQIATTNDASQHRYCPGSTTPMRAYKGLSRPMPKSLVVINLMIIVFMPVLTKIRIVSFDAMTRRGQTPSDRAANNSCWTSLRQPVSSGLGKPIFQRPYQLSRLCRRHQLDRLGGWAWATSSRKSPQQEIVP